MGKAKKVYLTCNTPSGKAKIFSFEAKGKGSEALPGFNYELTITRKQEKKEGKAKND